ncbi:hypothetical protein EPUS_00247 [Endocarpon pusillum Z07020]|uniref:Uncharacterized protein n=1 Tax=Endocarpon pusillum (strain Z07020 / HMAS-L-300199) TaxID=1263415 RepID=U1HIM6_ENDPU|nr:uncharacterized protein EPUS_00247 [Endocarpon pusillum Z07020]ERF70060.1 hypothetical protein EPUS_00247 [Endocarpon pusillum Z07020]
MSPPTPGVYFDDKELIDSLMPKNTYFDTLLSDASSKKRRRSSTDDEEDQTMPNKKRQQQQHDNEDVSARTKRHRSSDEVEQDGLHANKKKRKDYHENVPLLAGTKHGRSSIGDEQELLLPSAKRYKYTHEHELVGSAELASKTAVGITAEDDGNDDLAEDATTLASEEGRGISSEGKRDNPDMEIIECASTTAAPGSAQTRNPSKVNSRIVKNEIRNISDVGLEVRIREEWRPAITHPDYVSRLPSASIDPANYEHKRASGKDANDFTAYLESQRTWGPERADRPDILFVYKIPRSGWNSSNPSLLTYNDNGLRRVVIDVINNRPLKAFDNLPVTISKKVEGWLLETWERQNRNIDVEDFIQRMRFNADDNVWKSKKFSNALTQRKERFRNRGRCICWKKAQHDREWDRKLEAEMKNNATWIKANTTRHLDDLTVKEDRALAAATFIYGGHMRRAAGRELQGDAKIEKEENMRALLDQDESDDDGQEAGTDLESSLSKVANAQAVVNCDRCDVEASSLSELDTNEDLVQTQVNTAPEEVPQPQDLTSGLRVTGSEAQTQASATNTQPHCSPPRKTPALSDADMDFFDSLGLDMLPYEENYVLPPYSRKVMGVSRQDSHHIGANPVELCTENGRTRSIRASTGQRSKGKPQATMYRSDVTKDSRYPPASTTYGSSESAVSAEELPDFALLVDCQSDSSEDVQSLVDMDLGSLLGIHPRIVDFNIADYYPNDPESLDQE